MSGERRPRELEASPLALHLALWIPFAVLVVLSWFTVIAPELASEPPPNRSGEDARGAAGSAQPADQPAR